MPAVAPEKYSGGDVAILAGEYQKIGGRKVQEDRCVCVPDLNEVAKKHNPQVPVDVRRAFFAVFDGFGGTSSSEWLKDNFHHLLTRHEAFADNPERALQETFGKVDQTLLETIVVPCEFFMV